MKTIVKYINIIGNTIILNILFILTSVLSLSLCTGTALSALYATFLDLKTDDSGYYIRNYFKHLKNNFKQTIVFNIVLLLLGIATYLNILMINTIESSEIKLICFAVLGLVVLEILLVSSFIYPVIAKFNGKKLELLYLSFAFAHKYIYISILFIIFAILSIYLVLYVSFAFIFIIFGLMVYIESLILKYIWRGYQYEISEF